MYKANGNVGFIEDALYQMKQDYGVPATYYVFQQSDFNPQTGTVDLKRIVHQLKKIIRFPTNILRRVIQDIAYLAANKNFTYGASYDENVTIIIIDQKDLPRGLILNMNDFFTFDDLRFTIKKIDKLEHDLGYIVTLQAQEGANPYRTFTESVVSRLMYQHTTAGAL